MTNDRDPAGAGRPLTDDSLHRGRRSPREPIFNLPPVVMALIAICVGVQLVRMWLLSPQQDYGVILRFAFWPVRYSGGYIFDSYALVAPVSYSFLHGGLAHLVVNMIWLAAFGSPLANRIGPLRFLLFWVLTSVAAVGLHFVLHMSEAVPLVGASGAISGMMGAAARFGFHIDRTARGAAFGGPILSIPAVFTSRTAVTFLAVWFAANLLVGVGFGVSDDGSSVAWEAHIGGFLAGFLLVRLFDKAPSA